MACFKSNSEATSLHGFTLRTWDREITQKGTLEESGCFKNRQTEPELGPKCLGKVTLRTCGRERLRITHPGRLRIFEKKQTTLESGPNGSETPPLGCERPPCGPPKDPLEATTVCGFTQRTCNRKDAPKTSRGRLRIRPKHYK